MRYGSGGKDSAVHARSDSSTNGARCRAWRARSTAASVSRLQVEVAAVTPKGYARGKRKCAVEDRPGALRDVRLLARSQSPFANLVDQNTHVRRTTDAKEAAVSLCHDLQNYIR